MAALPDLSSQANTRTNIVDIARNPSPALAVGRTALTSSALLGLSLSLKKPVKKASMRLMLLAAVGKRLLNEGPPSLGLNIPL